MEDSIKEDPPHTNTESVNSKVFKLGFIFDTHSNVINAGALDEGEKISSALTEIFQPGERNILFMENVLNNWGSLGLRLSYFRGLNLYEGMPDRHKKALAYMVLKSNLEPNVEINNELVDSALDSMKKVANNTGETEYDLFLADVLDNIELKGYKIEVFHEEGVDIRNYQGAEAAIDGNDTKDNIEALSRLTRDRNTKLIKQIGDIKKGEMITCDATKDNIA